MSEDATEVVRQPSPPEAGGHRGEVLAALLIGVGGVLLVAGSPLEFANASGVGYSESVNGLDVIEGRLFLGGGLALVVLGVVLGLARSAALKRALAFLGILGSVFLLWVAVLDVATLGDDLPEEVAGSIEVSVGIGLLAGLVGSALTLLGSGIGIFAAEAALSRQEEEQGPPAIPPAGDTPTLEPPPEADRTPAGEPGEAPPPAPPP